LLFIFPTFSLFFTFLISSSTVGQSLPIDTNHLFFDFETPCVLTCALSHQNHKLATGPCEPVPSTAREMWVWGWVEIMAVWDELISYSINTNY
jgi:hypothetical protein